MKTGDTVEAAAPTGTAQTQVLSLSGPSLAPRPNLGVQREETVVSLGETGIQAHFPANLYHRQFWPRRLDAALYDI